MSKVYKMGVVGKDTIMEHGSSFFQIGQREDAHLRF